MPNYMKEAGMSYGQGGPKKKKKTASYGGGGGTMGPPKIKSYKRGGSLGTTPTSLPGGCGGKRKK